MKFVRLLGLVFIFNAILISSVGNTSADSSNKDVKKLMHDIYSKIVVLRPYLVSEEKFKDPKNREIIMQSLIALEERTDQLPPKKITEASSFAITYDLLTYHIRESKALYESKYLDYARVKLNATTSLCIACHTRLPKKWSEVGLSWIKGVFGSKEEINLKNAEFYFISRQFNKALKVYDAAIRDYPKSGIIEFDFDEIYQRKMEIFTRIIRDPKRAIKSLKTDLKNKKLPFAVKRQIETWIFYFDSWEDSYPEQMNNKELLEFSKKTLKHSFSDRAISLSKPHIIDLLRVSGLLYERLFKDPKAPEMPEILYVLAQCERRLAPLKIYSLGDIYLFQCVKRYPKSPVAKACFKDYEDSMTTRYRGTVPEAVRRNIEALKEHITN